MAHQAHAQVGVVGMAVMGRNLALNISDHGFKVAVFNRDTRLTEAAVAESGGAMVATSSLQDLVGRLERPRKIVMMIKAGAPVDQVMGDLQPLLDEGDIVVDGGNSWYEDTQRREKTYAAAGLRFVGTGVSGGEDGARHGPSIMPGGAKDAYAALAPIFEAIAAKTDSGPCVTHVGPDGAGHFVKMVHNGIEYADMQFIAEAVFARALSGSVAQRKATTGLASGDLGENPSDADKFTEDIRQALYASKIVAYAQGFNQIQAGSAEYDWGITPGDMATIWRGGCIIRAKFLNRIKDAFDNDPELPTLIVDPYFRDAIENAIDGWRRVVVKATELGIPIPGFSSALSYYDGLRTERLPAALTQGLRDFFGAHTYGRIDTDREKRFHTLWSGDRSEVEA